MANLRSKIALEEFLKLLNEAHIQSGRSLREVSDLCIIDRSYVSFILNGHRHPNRDVLIALCMIGWNLDVYDTDLILKEGRYKTILNWQKAGWDSLVNTSQH